MIQYTKVKKHRISANYTVEAAFIVPMILGIIFAMIYMLFLLHDKAVLQADLRENVICIDENQKNSSYVNKREKNRKTGYKNGISKTEISKNLKIFKITNVKCDIGKLYIKAEVTAVSKIDVPVARHFMKKKRRISFKTKYLRVRPNTFVRYRNKKGAADGK